MKLTPEQKIETLCRYALAKPEWEPVVGMWLTRLGDSLEFFQIEEVTPNEIHTNQGSFATSTRFSRLVPIPQSVVSQLVDNTPPPLKLEVVGRSDPHVKVLTLAFNRRPTDDERRTVAEIVSDVF